MDKTQLLNRLAANSEDRLLLSHALDQLRLAEQRAQPTHTGFLSPAQCAAVETLCQTVGGAALWTLGGYPEAERRRCLFLPDWMSGEDVEDADYVCALRASWYAPHSLSHRDLLGSLMGLGVKREALGDLLVSEGSCDVLLLPELQGYVSENWVSAGREKLRVEPLPLTHLHFPQPRVKTLRESVPSLRLDAVAAACFGVSRSKMTDLIRSGKAAVNHRAVLRPDLPLTEGDLLSCRGLGKGRLAQVGGSTRKGRISVVVERFL